METVKERVLTLLLINRGKTFSNSYGLCKVLSRIFGIINCHEIIEFLLKENFVIVDEKKNGIEYFSILQAGIEFMTRYRDELILELKRKFPEEYEIIDAL